MTLQTQTFKEWLYQWLDRNDVVIRLASAHLQCDHCQRTSRGLQSCCPFHYEVNA